MRLSDLFEKQIKSESEMAEEILQDITMSSGQRAPQYNGLDVNKAAEFAFQLMRGNTPQGDAIEKAFAQQGFKRSGTTAPSPAPAPKPDPKPAPAAPVPDKQAPVKQKPVSKKKPAKPAPSKASKPASSATSSIGKAAQFLKKSFKRGQEINKKFN